ncbi:MAG: DUF1501 domain-containing protein [Planctomycetes bacterium]|nr:DUF1501 domain-containing protein [Planctomycetota bacterium]
MSSYTRRDLLFSLAALPLARAADPLLRWVPWGDERCLVVLELEGGNDGLNTVIPLDDGLYVRARPALSAVRRGASAVAGGHGLHAALHRLVPWFRDGFATAVQGVGYPRPDRSHFRSRDIWHAADPALQRVSATTSGWLGRAADQLAAQGAPLPGLAIGSMAMPLCVVGRRVVVPTLERIEEYALPAAEGEAGRARRASLGEVLAVPQAEGPAAAIAEIARSAVASGERLGSALARYSAMAEYPATALGRRLQLVAQVVVSGFGTRLLHLVQGGYDTHARQLPTHEALLRELGDALAAFLADLRGHGALARTAVLVHSEFGRRVAENQSLGTDHGAAAPVFVCGAGVRAPLLGSPPRLDRLDDGDLHADVDFRSVYAALLARTGIAVEGVIGDVPAPLEIFG